MYIINGMFKIIGIIIILSIGAATCGILFGKAEPKSDCYFEDYPDQLNQILVGTAISEEVLKYAKYEGASADGFLISQEKKEDGNYIVEVESYLKAQNAFGVYSTTKYKVTAILYCDGYTVTNIEHK
jgi:hypothetical protein